MAQNFDQIVLANGFKINKLDKCIYSKFNDEKGVIICLYVDDMLTFGIDFEQVTITKESLSSNFARKDMRQMSF